jgi:hypothetical protein
VLPGVWVDWHWRDPLTGEAVEPRCDGATTALPLAVLCGAGTARWR